MSRIAYVNGRYVPHQNAVVHIEDRGYQFADGVYEVCEVRGGRLVDERRHLQRLYRSLSELAIADPGDRPQPANRRNTRDVFWPPNPKLFESTASARCSRARLGT